MKRFDQSSAQCYVYTFKEGLLSVLAHDLRIAATSFVIELYDGHLINARFDAESLRVECAMVDGVERPDLLGEEARKEIDSNIIRSVLDANIYREIVLTSSSVTKEDSSYLVKGTLTAHGTTRDITFTVKEEDGLYTAEVNLHLPDFGITPFSAMFGMIKIKPDILVRVIVPKNGEGG